VADRSLCPAVHSSEGTRKSPQGAVLTRMAHTVQVRFMLIPGHFNGGVIAYPLVPWVGLTFLGIASAPVWAAGADRAANASAVAAGACLALWLLVRPHSNELQRSTTSCNAAQHLAAQHKVLQHRAICSPRTLDRAESPTVGLCAPRKLARWRGPHMPREHATCHRSHSGPCHADQRSSTCGGQPSCALGV
jgi:hypothetical protein